MFYQFERAGALEKLHRRMTSTFRQRVRRAVRKKHQIQRAKALAFNEQTKLALKKAHKHIKLAQKHFSNKVTAHNSAANFYQSAMKHHSQAKKALAMFRKHAKLAKSQKQSAAHHLFIKKAQFKKAMHYHKLGMAHHARARQSFISGCQPQHQCGRVDDGSQYGKFQCKMVSKCSQKSSRGEKHMVQAKHYFHKATLAAQKAVVEHTKALKDMNKSNKSNAISHSAMIEFHQLIAQRNKMLQQAKDYLKKAPPVKKNYQHSTLSFYG